MSHHTHHPAHPCLNCATSLEAGWEYCPACGQKNEELRLPLKHILEEVAEGIWHFDSKLWATVKAIATRPGKITAEFLDGHRVRYVPPIRLYVFVSFVFFLLLSTLSHRISEDETESGIMPETQVNGSNVNFNYNIKSGEDTASPADKANLIQITKRAARLTALSKEGIFLSALDAAQIRKMPDSVRLATLFDSLAKHLPRSLSLGHDAASLKRQNESARDLMDLGKSHRVLLRPLEGGGALAIRVLYVQGVPLDSANAHTLLHGSSQARDALFRKYKVTGFMNQLQAKRAARMDELKLDEGANPLKDPALFGGALKASSVGMFLFMPITALLLYLLFGRSRRFYAEHLIHALHLHAVFFLVCIIFWFLPSLFNAPEAISDFGLYLLVLLAFAYPLASVKRVYNQGWGKTVGKYLAMVLGFGFLQIVFLIMVLAYTVATY